MRATKESFNLNVYYALYVLRSDASPNEGVRDARDARCPCEMPSRRRWWAGTLASSSAATCRAIVDAIEQYGIYDVDELSLALDASFGALQLQVGDAAPPVFLALLKAWLGAGPAAPPSTPAMPMPPSTPSTESPPAFAPEPAAAPTAHPMVVMVKFNGKVIVERSTVQLPPSTPWEQVVRLRLGDLAEQYMDTTLKVALYPTGQQKESERVGAAISDAVGPSFALGYPFAVLSFSAPVYACARPAAKGVDAFAPMMAKARAEAGEGALMLPKPYVPKEEGGKEAQL